MSFHSVIYEELKSKDDRIAVLFLREYRAFTALRSLARVNSFAMVSAYFFSIFSVDPSRYHRELRCITGNPTCSLWLEDFRQVVAETYIADHASLSIGSHASSRHQVSELGDLLGIS